MLAIVSKGFDNIVFCSSGDLSISLNNCIGLESSATDRKVILLINNLPMGRFPLEIAKDIINKIRLLLTGCFHKEIVIDGIGISPESHYLLNLYDGEEDDTWYEISEDPGKDGEDPFKLASYTIKVYGGTGKDLQELRENMEISEKEYQNRKQARGIELNPEFKASDLFL